MQHLTIAEKTLLIGDQAADLLLEYAALIARISAGDSVTFNAIGADGDEVVMTVLLNSGTTMVAATTTSTLREPDNSALERYLEGRLEAYNGYPTGLGTTDLDTEA